MHKDEEERLELDEEWRWKSMKNSTLFNHPRSCPAGHRQISWHLRESEVFCWLCNKGYDMSECSRSSDASSLSFETEPGSTELPASAAV
jgi:hypothetical protein